MSTILPNEAEPDVISQLREIGIVLLMFSIGNEIDLHNFTQNFYKQLAITVVQLLLGFLSIYMLGQHADWNLNTIVLTSFIISLSSSAIVFQYLIRTGEVITT